MKHILGDCSSVSGCSSLGSWYNIFSAAWLCTHTWVLLLVPKCKCGLPKFYFNIMPTQRRQHSNKIIKARLGGQLKATNNSASVEFDSIRMIEIDNSTRRETLLNHPAMDQSALGEKRVAGLPLKPHNLFWVDGGQVTNLWADGFP